MRIFDKKFPPSEFKEDLDTLKYTKIYKESLFFIIIENNISFEQFVKIKSYCEECNVIVFFGTGSGIPVIFFDDFAAATMFKLGVDFI